MNKWLSKSKLYINPQPQVLQINEQQINRSKE